jgi:hypothetical protein
MSLVQHAAAWAMPRGPVAHILPCARRRGSATASHAPQTKRPPEDGLCIRDLDLIRLRGFASIMRLITWASRMFCLSNTFFEESRDYHASDIVFVGRQDHRHCLWVNRFNERRSRTSNMDF